MPRVNVIVPCYNREQLLGATLESLRSQTFPDWDGIIVDDGSADGSVAVAQAFSAQDSRFRVVSRQGDRKGANICRNQGLALAQGDYIIFLDSDDLLGPACLDNRVRAMDNSPGFDFGVYQTEMFTEMMGDRQTAWSEFTEGNDLHRFLSLDTVWLISGPIWRRKSVERLGGFDEEITSLQDWELHMRAMISGMRYYKESVRDHFYRRQYEGIATISSVSSVHPAHLRSHEKLFTKTYNALKSANLLDQEVRCRMAGLFWWLARLWRRNSDSSQADKVWRLARDFGLCNRREYLEGRLIFRLYSMRGGGRLSRLIQRSWPQQYLHICLVGPR